jgi:molecular chaperone GrpE (heat shock protein)
MNINFNIPDEIGVQFISASRWSLNTQEFTDERIIKKSLKRYIGSLIDSYNKSQILNVTSSLISTLETQMFQLQQQYQDIRMEFENTKRTVNATYVPVDLGPD